ncbi:MAG TPA: amino acid decarboxylase, partial [Clostridiales bacterium]|nr:amino acid decarboxylase [Clostridiales bacterium]
MASLLEQANIFSEFADREYIVFMLTPENTPEQLELLQKTLCGIPRRELKPAQPLLPTAPEVICSPRQAAFSPQERIPVECSLGRVLAEANVA